MPTFDPGLSEFSWAHTRGPIVGTCRRDLSQGLVAGTCRRNLSQELVEGTCRRDLLQGPVPRGVATCTQIRNCVPENNNKKK